MKKLITLILVLSFILSLCACGANSDKKKEKDPTIVMPYGLVFGMSYDKIVEVYNSSPSNTFKLTFPELEGASNNNGSYVATPTLVIADINAFFGFSEDIIFYYPREMYSFNEDKKLYEYYIGGTLKSESEAETVFNAMTGYYSQQLGKEALYNETASELTATIKTDSISVSFHYMIDSGTVLAVVHSHDYELGK